MSRLASLAWCSIATVLPLLACRTAQLSDKAGTVAAGRNAPPPECRPIKYLTGRGGGTFGGGYISNDKLVEYALNDLRNQAAEVGANYVQHDAPQLGSGDGTTTTATITGTAYACDGETPADTPAPSPPAVAHAQPKPERPVPSGGAGFDFGKTEEECAEVCTGAERTWNGLAENRFSCSGTATDLGVDASVIVGFCDHRVCGVQVEVRPPEDPADLEPEYMKFLAALERKYGRAQRQDRVPLDCGTPTKVVCFESGRARRRANWKWPTGEHVVVILGKPGKQEGPVAIRLYYAVDPKGKGVNSDAL